MSISFELQAEPRSDVGKGASRRLRHAGRVPAIMYGGGEDPVSLTLDHQKLIHSLENEAFYSHILSVNVAGKVQKAVLRDLQRHPSKPTVLHVDFQRVSDKEAIRVNVPLHFKGEDIAPGVKTEGGMVSHEVNDVEVECLPGDLPEFIEVDISALNVGDSLHLSDLVMPKGVVLVQLQREHDLGVVSIHARKIVVEEEDTPTEEAEGEPAGEKPPED